MTSFTNSHTACLQMDLDLQSGSLERLLNVIRKRGFEIKYLLVDQKTSCYRINMRLQNTPRGSVDFQNLKSHLNNQLSISNVAISVVFRSPNKELGKPQLSPKQSDEFHFAKS